MTRTFEIENFRKFRSLKVKNLGRINLIVGGNNSGKTTILEAFSLYSSGGPLESYRILERRQEHLDQKILLSPLFNKKDRSIQLHSLENPLRSVHCSISIENRLKFNFLFGEVEYSITSDNLKNGESLLKQAFNNPKENSGLLTGDPFDGEPVWLGINSMRAKDVVLALNELMLTSNEEVIVRALQILEPKLRRIAPEVIVEGATRGGVRVLLEGEQQPQSITSMGEGVWRILGVILSLIRAEGGVLLIDEIDTGLHYTTLEDLWRIIFEVAEDLDVQVFATTHSSDCWRAFAQAMSADQDASLQRIEGDTAVAYTPEVLKSAEEMDLEVR